MNIASLLFLFVMAFGNTFGQQEQGPNVRQTFKPGDTVHYFITFQSPIKGTPVNTQIFFSLISQRRTDQPSFSTDWQGNEMHQKTPTIVEVDGERHVRHL